MRKVADNYDFIIIDCPPSLSMLTVNSMTTADTVLVPIQCEFYALEGLSQLMHTINLVKRRLNPRYSVPDKFKHHDGVKAPLGGKVCGDPGDFGQHRPRTCSSGWRNATGAFQGWAACNLKPSAFF